MDPPVQAALAHWNLRLSGEASQSRQTQADLGILEARSRGRGFQGEPTSCKVFIMQQLTEFLLPNKD